MVISGLDWSMSCPAICIFDDNKVFKFDNCDFFFLTDKKKFTGRFDNIEGTIIKDWSCDTERFDIISEWGISKLKTNKVQFACLEGYSMGSSKGLVFNIAENIGLLKYKMLKNNIAFETPAPTTIKKYFTGKGNAKKEDMYDAFFSSEGIDLCSRLGVKSGSSPISDIVDSFALTKYLINNSK